MHPNGYSAKIRALMCVAEKASDLDLKLSDMYRLCLSDDLIVSDWYKVYSILPKTI
jgi:hypothetical protein